MKARKMLSGKIMFAVALALCAFGASGADRVVTASSFGWSVEDSTAALQAAFDSGARTVVIDRQAGDWITRPLFITNSNIEVVLADGVTLKAKPGEYHGNRDCLICIAKNVKNIMLRGSGNSILAMNKADYVDPKNGYSFSEWRHAVSILMAQNVTVKDLTILSSGGDGIYVNGAKGVTLENLVLRDHYRQGMSPISVTDMTVRRCVFNDTLGTPPQSGIDMEPNQEKHRFMNVVYEDCVFNGNQSHGINLHFANFNARTQPVSITFRRCKAYGNKNTGLTIMTGVPNRIEKFGQVKGALRFEDCEFANNGREAVKILNHSTNGMDICFANCIFDARGSGAESAIRFSNGWFPGNFGGLSFERCSIKLDEGREVCLFDARPGFGVGGKFTGTLAVERGGNREMFDLAAFAAKHKPRPELVVRFDAAEVEFPALKAMSGNLPEKGTFIPFVRGRFVYVVAVPGAGEYKIRFNSKKVNKNRPGTLAGRVQLLDKAGTELAGFEVPIGDFEYTLKANCANVYRFDVLPCNTAIIRVACDGAAAALLANNPVYLFTGRDAPFHFCVPAAAETVSVRINPSEAVQAELIDASGRKVAEMPYQTRPVIFNVRRAKTASDEVWKLRFVKIQEDMSFQIGVDGIPLCSPDLGGVIGRK